MSEIYLDNNATTRVPDEVREAMLPYLGTLYGNPSSTHTFGSQINSELEKARLKIAELINAEPEEIVFTSCGTESDNTAIMSALLSNPDKKHIVTTSVEHPAVINFFKTMVSRGYTATFLPVDSYGRLSLEELASAIKENTALVSIMHANNETGTLFPIDRVASIVHSKGAQIHSDAIQAVGKIPLDTKKIMVDMLSISGHKLHAPKGIGALFVRKGTNFSPYLIGGHQEKSRRAGTENVASIIGMGKACEIAKNLLHDEYKRIKTLRDRLEEGLLKTCPDTLINGDRENRLPNTTNAGFRYIEGEAILLRMNEYNICASSGSACTSGFPEPSHVLRAMGVPVNTIHGSIRFSLSRYNTDEDISFVLEKMPKIIEELRALSPFGRKEKPR